jgi:hypothetical protein
MHLAAVMNCRASHSVARPARSTAQVNLLFMVALN